MSCKSFQRLPILLLLCGVIPSVTATAQSRDEKKPDALKERENSFALFGGMRIDLAAAPALVDYINTFADPSQRAADFATDVEFFGGAEFPLSDEWGGAVEYAYLFKSYTLQTAYAGTYTLFYNVHMPLFMAHYIVPGKGYFVKLGGGIGYHLGSVTQTNSIYGADSTYHTRGVGMKAQIVGQTAFDDHLYGYISGDLRWEFFGELKNANGNELRNLGQTASLSMFAAGVAFGLTYYF